MRDLRRVYRAQYLQKLAEVTESERVKEQELREQELAERRRRKEGSLQRIGEDMKRRAILKDRKRIEQKVNEAMEMARRSKVKRRQLFWLRRMENLSHIIVSAENFDEAFGTFGKAALTVGGSGAAASDTSSTSASGVLLSRNVSVPFLLRQLGGSKGFPMQRSRRIPLVDNVQREILESSYELMGEDEPRLDPEPAGMTQRERANLTYGGFTEVEKQELLEKKIDMLKKHRDQKKELGIDDQIVTKLLDALDAARVAARDPETQQQMKETARQGRGPDVPGLPRR